MFVRHILTAAVAAIVGIGAAQAETIKIGVTPGPHAQVLEFVKPLAAKKGLDIQIIEFSDYVIPNTALDAGEIQANSFQHLPYLENQKKDRGFKIDSAGYTLNFPLGIYSKKHKTFAEVPDGGKIAIQNDPTNGGRSLLLMQDRGIIKLKPNAGIKPSVADIVDNPKKLKFIEVEAAQTPRSLDDVDAASINTNYATQAGLTLNDAILKEDAKGPYVNIIAVRTVDKDKPWVKTLLEVYHSPEVKAFVLEKFKGAVLPSW